MTASAIYTGRLRHRRYLPAENHFRYGLFMMYLDLAELPDLFDGLWSWSARRPTLAWFRRADYLGDPACTLDESVRERVQEATGRRPAGPIRLLTHLRYFGYIFNPVSFYYCFDATGERVETIVAEITNTPWKERHAYVLAADRNEADAPHFRFRFDKNFHVSPFMDMNHRYDWRFTTPGDGLAVHMENYQEGRRLFDATLTLHRRAITPMRLRGLLLRYPLMTARIITLIHYQALRLWWKRCPFFTHPAKRRSLSEHPTP